MNDDDHTRRLSWGDDCDNDSEQNHYWRDCNGVVPSYKKSNQNMNLTGLPIPDASLFSTLDLELISILPEQSRRKKQGLSGASVLKVTEKPMHLFS